MYQHVKHSGWGIHWNDINTGRLILQYLRLLYPKFEDSQASGAEQASLSLTRSHTSEDRFSHDVAYLLKILDFGQACNTGDQMTGYVAAHWCRAPEIMLQLCTSIRQVRYTTLSQVSDCT